MTNRIRKTILAMLLSGTCTLHAQYDLIIRNCHVLTAECEIKENCDIFIHQGKFVAIAEAGTIDDVSTKKIQAHGMVAMPGLINTHAHTAMSVFRGVAEDLHFEQWWYEKIRPLEEKLTPNDVYWGTMLGLAQMIQSGITTVADHYFFMDSVAQAFEKTGMRGILGQAMFDFQGDQALQNTRAFVKKWNGSAEGKITTVVAPHAPYTCNDNFLSKVASLAKELGVGIHIHASETIQQTNESINQTSKTPIQILEQSGILNAGVPVILAHGCGLLETDIELLAQYKEYVGIACASKTYGKLAMGHTPILSLNKDGINVGLATDGAASNNSYDLFEVMRLMAMNQKNVSQNPENLTLSKALHIATQGGAAVVGLKDKIGQIAPGFCADMILVNLEGLHHQPVNDIRANLVYNTYPQDVDTVIIDGNIVIQHGKFLTLDIKEIVRNANACAARLRS